MGTRLDDVGKHDRIVLPLSVCRYLCLLLYVLNVVSEWEDVTYLCDHSLVCCRRNRLVTPLRGYPRLISASIYSERATAVKYTRFCGDTVLLLVHGCREARRAYSSLQRETFGKTVFRKME